MSFVSRGFHRRQADPEQDGRVPPGQYVTTDFPVLSAGPTPHRPLESWSFSIAGEVDEPLQLDVGRVPRAAQREHHQGHPLRDQVVEARHELGGRLAGHPARRRGDVRRVRGRLQRRRLHHQSPARGRDRRQGLGRVRLRRRAARARARRAGAAARAAPVLLEEREVGARAAAAQRRRAGLLGGATATTTTATHGSSSVTRATDLAARRASSSRSRRRRGSGASCCDAPEWAGHRAGQHVDVRLTAEDGYQAQRSYSIASAPEDESPGAHRRAAGRRRGLAVPGRRAPAGRSARAARADRRLLRLGCVSRSARCCSSGAARASSR